MRAVRTTKGRELPVHGSTTAAKRDAKTPAGRRAQTRKMNRLKDEVYREMLLLEVNRPGSEMALALALLRAVVQCVSLSDQEEFAGWLETVCPIGLQMIEDSLGDNFKCGLRQTP